jgi:thioredoxin 1
MKHLLPYIKVFLPLLLLLLFFLAKDEVLQFLGSSLIEGQPTKTEKVFPQYNLNDRPELKGSLIEIGAKSCLSCRKMEAVIASLEERYADSLHIERVNITEAEGLARGKVFGMVAIPTQIILDPSGREVFRHTGFIPREALEKELKTTLGIND